MTSRHDSHTITRQLAEVALDLSRARTLDEVLDRLVEVAAAVVPGCDRASVTLRDGDRLSTPAATDGDAASFDELQYDLGEGPCIDALERPIVVAQGETWEQWPGFARKKPAVLAAAVSCGLPLACGPAVALNLYTTTAFGDDGHDVALALAAHAAVAVAAAVEREAGPDATDPHRIAQALGEMLDRAHLVPPDRLPDLGQDVARYSGVRATRVWVVDYAHRRLLPLGQPPEIEGFDIDGTVGGRAFLLGKQVELVHDDGVIVWSPLINGVDRLGVVQFELDRIDDRRRVTLAKIAQLLASEIVTRGQYTDAVAVARRTDDLTLAAEFQWNVFRPPAFATSDVTVAAAVEPAYRVGGDGYDYAYNDGILHAVVFDAVGHDLDASMIGNLFVATLRWCRRRGLDLRATAETIDRVIDERLADTKYATAVLAELDVAGGVLSWINSGHPAPMLIRDGRVVAELVSPPSPPIGLAAFLGLSTGTVSQVTLQPGDRVLLYTDGVVEARMAGGEDFGVERLNEFIHRAVASGLSGSEIVRRLAHAVIDHHGPSLRDDATIFLVHWHPATSSAAG